MGMVRIKAQDRGIFSEVRYDYKETNKLISSVQAEAISVSTLSTLVKKEGGSDNIDYNETVLDMDAFSNNYCRDKCLEYIPSVDMVYVVVDKATSKNPRFQSVEMKFNIGRIGTSNFKKQIDDIFSKFNHSKQLLLSLDEMNVCNSAMDTCYVLMNNNLVEKSKRYVSQKYPNPKSKNLPISKLVTICDLIALHFA